MISKREPPDPSGKEKPTWDLARIVPAPLRRFGTLLWLTVREARAVALHRQAYALAFITLFALIPLLAAFSSIGARAFQGRQGRLVELLSQVLPYPEETILERLGDFLHQAESIDGVGFLLFILTSLLAFTHVEETLGRIWKVPRRRPLRSRLLSFTLLMFWGGLVLGALGSSGFLLRQWGVAQTLASVPLGAVRFTVSLVGLTMLYYSVPHTVVRFRFALLGGSAAAILLEGLRQGFGIYVQHLTNVITIYGGFGLAVFFMVSIQLTWWIVLLGAQMAYVAQHEDLLLRPRRKATPLEGSWLGLAAAVVMTERFQGGEPWTPPEELAERLGLGPEELRKVLEPLVEAGILRGAEETQGYLLGQDPHGVAAADILERYEAPHLALLDPLPAAVALRLRNLRLAWQGARGEALGQRTLADLAGSTPTASPQKGISP